MTAYIIFTRLRTRNPAELALYAKEAPIFLAGHAINWLARFGARCETLEGAEVEGAAILEFPTLAEARAWYASPAYQEASQHRFRGGDYCAILVEGAIPDATQ
jgi:uncharacterized protein (DUF1330 family)